MTTNQGVGGSNPSWVTMKSAKQKFSGFFIVRKGAFGHAYGVRVQRVQKVQRVQRVQRVADCRSAAMLIKSALRDDLAVSYGIISILRIGSLRSPPPIRLRRTSPCSGGRINRSMLSCRNMAPRLSIHSPTTEWAERWWRQPPKGDCISTPAGRLYGFIQTGAFYNLEAPTTTLAPEARQT